MYTKWSSVDAFRRNIQWHLFPYSELREKCCASFGDGPNCEKFTFVMSVPNGWIQELPFIYYIQTLIIIYFTSLSSKCTAMNIVIFINITLWYAQIPEHQSTGNLAYSDWFSEMSEVGSICCWFILCWCSGYHSVIFFLSALTNLKPAMNGWTFHEGGSSPYLDLQ